MAKEKKVFALSNEELNDFFKEMSTEDEDGRLWNIYAEKFVETVMDSLSSLLNLPKFTFGSTAERLKCCTPHDIGDFDLMFFSSRDEMRISPDRLSDIPGCPGFVYINGCGHPVLKDCLYQDTNYVATSALTGFHPSVFGRVSALLQALPMVMKVMSVHMDPGKMAIKLSNNCQTGPAVTLDFAQSFPNYEKQLTDSSGLKVNERNRWLFEFFAMELCRLQGIEYGEKERYKLDYFLRFANEELNKLKEQPTTESSVEFMQTMMTSEKMLAVGAEAEQEWKETEEKKKERENTDESFSNLGAENHVNENALPVESCTSMTEYTSRVLSKKHTLKGKETFIRSSKDAAKIEQHHDQHQGQEKTVRAQVDENESLSVSQSHIDNETKSFRKPVSSTVSDENVNSAIKNVCKSLLGIYEETYKQCVDSYEERALQHDRVSGVDVVPSFQCSGWPAIAREWEKRKRIWPSEETVKQIIKEGFHVVVKTPKSPDVNPDIAFRLSFSNAEYLLSQKMSRLQKDCYRCLKLYHKAYLKTEQKVLVTFHLKTILLWTCEETGTDFWTENNRGACLMMLLDKLHRALVTRNLPHFFMPTLNLLADAAAEHPDTIKVLEKKIEDIMKDPTQFKMEHIKRCLGEEPKYNVSSPRCTDETVLTKNSETSSHKSSSTEQDYENHPPYFDFKAKTHEIFQEVLDLASGKDEVDISEELMISAVEAVKKCQETVSFSDAEFKRVLDHGMEMTYNCSLLDPNPSLRGRILRGIISAVKLWQYIAEQPEVHTGNADVISRRMLGLNVSEDERFDLNSLFPTEGTAHFMRQIFGVFDPPTSSEEKEELYHLDPLDQMPLD